MSEGREIRVALIMGGGVSLGSFSGGALLKTIELLQHTARGRAKIDVVTGASAGSMTLGVVIYHLMRGSSSEEVLGDLKRSWVDMISFDGLCPPDLARHDQPSLFSDGVVRTIAQTIIDLDRNLEAAPHPLFADELVASFALTNLNGIPARAEGQLVRQGKVGGGAKAGAQSVFADAVQTTFHHDIMRFVVRRNHEGRGKLFDDQFRARILPPWNVEGGRSAWEAFREAAIASGAFPAAFPPVEIRRDKHEFNIWPDRIDDQSAFTFDYVDGGVLRNEPLREAIHLASKRDEGATDFERVFILIDPNISGTGEVFPLSYNQQMRIKPVLDAHGDVRQYDLDVPAYTGNLLGAIGRLGSVIVGQATFRDWLKAAKVNSQIEWRRELVPILRDLNPNPGDDARKGIERMIYSIYRQKYQRTLELKSMPDDEVERKVAEDIERDLARRREEVGDNDFTARLLLLVDLVGNLREKQKLNMVAITPASVPDNGGRPLPLAGNFMFSFGGFFREEYRQYDFSVGEYAAWNVLGTPASETPFLAESAPRPPSRPPEPPAINPTYRALGPPVQQRFENFVRGHVRAYVSSVAPLGTRGIVTGALGGRLRRMLLASRNGRSEYFRLRLTGVDGLYLRGSKGRNLRAVGDSIDTVVGVYIDEEDKRRDELFGPHIFGTGDSGFTMELWESRGVFARDRRVAVVNIENNPGGFATAAGSKRRPGVVVDLAGRNGQPLRTIDVREFA
jgi:predicted acylesterase/phospholipase RssA